MKNWLNYWPAFMKRLWRQFAISYMPLAFGAMTLLIIMLISTLENALTWLKRMAIR